jgi:DNA-binding phage protein
MANKLQRFAHVCQCSDCQQRPSSPVAAQHRALNDLLTLLDEKRRRLVAGALAKQHGRGGIALLAHITGMSRMTIRRGRSELAQPEFVSSARIRRAGGGRPRAEKKMSAAADDLGGLVA